MKTLIKIFLLVIIVQQSIMAQTGNEFFEKKDYRNAAIRYEIEVLLNANAYLNLGKAYFALHEFDLAIEALEKYKKEGTDVDLDYVNNFIELLVRDDDYVEIRNMGGHINSNQDDYIPVVTPDGKRLYFVGSERPGGMGGEDIWFSDKNADGSWKSPELFNQLNTDSHEGLFSISADNNIAIVFGNYEGSFGGGDLFYSVKTEDGWTMPCNLGGDINTGEWESQANFTADGKTMLFCNDINDSGGGSDIYVTELTVDGWTEPVNLGPTINTSKRDYAPFLASDMKTLYFQSYGHMGFGECDIYMSKRLDESWTNWSKPVNLGKYINTLDDDKYLTIPSSGTRGYMVRVNQPDGYGNADIYQFVLPPSLRPELVFNVFGTVVNEEGNPVGAIIKYFDVETNELKARAVSNIASGEYKIALPPYKKYQVVIDMKGYLYQTDILDLTNPDSLLSDETLNDKLVSEVANIIKYRKNFELYNAEIQVLLDTNNSNIFDGFKEYEHISKKYKINSRNLDLAIKRAKLAWLSEEEDELIMQEDYQLTTIRIGASFELKNIVFDFGKATLRDESQVELNKLYDIMDRSDVIIEFGGHTDNVGSEESNLDLSQRRVESVRTYLVDKGIESGRIAAVGYGETRPIASNETEEGRQKNRRVELQITDIRPRAGADELSEEDLKAKEEKEAANFDLLTTLQLAARKGGLPEGSPCSDKARYLSDDDYVYTPTKDKSKKTSSTDMLDKSNYIYKTFNPYILNYGYDNTVAEGMLFGAGLLLMYDNLAELHAEYYFKGTDSLKLQIGLGGMLAVQLTDVINLPITLHAGIDMNIMGVKDTLPDGKSLGAVFFNLPLGIRYIYQLNDHTYLGPEFMYVLGHKVDAFTVQNEESKVNSKYMRFGINARWRFIQGGVFYNMGEAINYPGFRVGLAF
ncbi:OmpA family protein [Bacteroidota bacterium]